MLEKVARGELLEDGGVVLHGEQVDMLGEGVLRYVSNLALSAFCSFSLSPSLFFKHIFRPALSFCLFYAGLCRIRTSD